MFCISCGNKQAMGAAFCQFCGAKHNVDGDTECLSTDQIDQARVAKESSRLKNAFPIADAEPIYILENCAWQFRYKDAASSPPDWAQGYADLMCSETHIFFQSKKSSDAEDEIANHGNAVGKAAGAAALFPIVGVAVGLVALGVDTISKKTKHSGFGKKSQFLPELMNNNFLAGDNIWAAKNECEFRALRSRLLVETSHYVAIIGKFHHASGLLDVAAFLRTYGHGTSIKRDLAERGGCIISRDDKFKVQSEAARSLEGYPLPQITTAYDDKYFS